MTSPLQEWAIGLAGGMALGWGLKWAQNALPTILASWVVSRVKAALGGSGLENAALKSLVHDLTLVLVRHAEKALPDAGLGSQRLAWIEERLSILPFRVGLIFRWIIASKPKEWRALVEACVAKMDEELKAISPSSPPAAS